MGLIDFEKSVRNLRKKFLSKKFTLKELEKEFFVLKEEKPLLFDMVCSEHCDEDVLNNMLDTMSNLVQGKLTQDKASEIFGGTLVDKYVKPVAPSST